MIADQRDGYEYRAVRTWPADQLHVEMALHEPDAGAAYGSTLTITCESGVGRDEERTSVDDR